MKIIIFTQSINSEIVEKDNFYNKIIEKANESLYVHGRRTNCIKILSNLHKFKDYETIKNAAALGIISEVHSNYKI